MIASAPKAKSEENRITRHLRRETGDRNRLIVRRRRESTIRWQTLVGTAKQRTDILLCEGPWVPVGIS